jgi:hypothetical protein
MLNRQYVKRSDGFHYRTLDCREPLEAPPLFGTRGIPPDAERCAAGSGAALISHEASNHQNYQVSNLANFAASDHVVGYPMSTPGAKILGLP